MLDNKGTIVVNYSGRHGGGNIDAYEMAVALVNRGENVVPIISKQIDNLDMWKDFPFQDLVVVNTYTDKVSFLINSLMFRFKCGAEIKKKTKNLEVKAIYCPMGTLWSDRINALFPKTKTVMVIHDPVSHSGTNWILKLFAKKRRKYDAIVVHSKVFVDEIKSLRKLGEPVYYIPLGRHNLYRTVKEKKKIISYDSKKINYLFFGRIEEYKGLDVLAKAWSELDRKYHDKITLSIVGNGDFSPYKESYSMYSNVNVVNRWIDDSEVESVFLGENLVCVCPYRDGTQSGVILVAMDYGVPSIASNTGGLGEQILHDETGLLVEPSDVNDLVSAMSRFVLDRELINKMKPKMKEFIDGISWDKSAEKLIEIIEELD